MSANISVGCGQSLIKIWDATVVQLKYLGRPEARIKQLQQAGAGLRAKADHISNSEGQIPSNQIQQSKSEVAELGGKAADLEQDIERRFHARGKSLVAGCSWNCFPVNRKAAKRMA